MNLFTKKKSPNSKSIEAAVFVKKSNIDVLRRLYQDEIVLGESVYINAEDYQKYREYLEEAEQGRKK